MYYELLKTWCDRLIADQITELGNVEYHGGIMCPSCARIHGRCGDALYPMMYLYSRTGEDKYLECAKLLFAWGEYNMVRPDGSYINGTNNDWKGITVFAAAQLGDALYYHGDLLDEQTRQSWQARFVLAADYMYDIIDTLKTNINYPAMTSATMAIAWRLLGEEKYKTKARALAQKVLGYIDGDGILFGEGKNADFVTPKGCRPIDIGYNVEESLPALVTYAEILEDEEVLQAATASLAAHLHFMLPDGAWDNSWGARSAKYSYWGSRTSDGCQPAYGGLMEGHPVFEEAAYRNTKLLEACTGDGLIHGGPMYQSAREPACNHHTFCRVKAIALMLQHGFEPEGGKAALPIEEAEGIKEFETARVCLLAKGGWRATLSDYDYDYGLEEGAATGGAITMLYHLDAGPLLCATMTTYQLVEPNNMQLAQQLPVPCQTPRLEYVDEDGTYYRSINDKTAQVSHEEGEVLRYKASGVLRSGSQAGSQPYRLGYEVAEERVTITVETEAPGALYHLPVNSKNTDPVEQVSPNSVRITTEKGVVVVESSEPLVIQELAQPLVNPYFDNGKLPAFTRTFNPVGGFEALPLYIALTPGVQAQISLSVENA